MYLTKLIIKNFQLFESIEIDFKETDLITFIKGINKDSLNESGNASGKSTIQNAILFGLYGNVTNLTLSELLRLNCKKASVELHFIYDNEQYIVIRTIPSSLEILKNDIKQEFSTATIAQQYLNKLIGDNKHFLTYRMIDNKKGINLLDLGVVSLRKSLMDFISNQFLEKRNNLLAQKLEREKYHKKYRPYPYYLSDKRKTKLQTGINRLNEELLELSKTKEQLVNKVNDYIIQQKTFTQKISLNSNQIASLSKQILLNQHEIESLSNYLQTRQIKPKSEKTCDFENDLTKEKICIAQLNLEIKSGETKVESVQKLLKDLEKKIVELHTINNEKNNKIKNIEKEISNLQILKSGVRCDKCGADITEENKLQFITDKEYDLHTLNEETYELHEELSNSEFLLEELNKELQTYKDFILNTKAQIENKEKEIEKVHLKEKEWLKEQEEITKSSIIVETKKQQLKEYELQIEENHKVLEDLQNLNIEFEKEINKIANEIKPTQDVIEESKKIIQLNENKIKIAERFLMQLNESFKFAEYKYDERDIELYNHSIKTLDDFSAYYISYWLENLEIIINDLLQNINMSVSFNIEKTFLTVKDNEEEFSYNQLSSGQKTFLNTIFKIGILLNEGINDGLLLIDEGLSDLDIINLKKLIPILKGLNFQALLIYQNIPQDIQDIKYLIVERENGVSTIK